MGSPVPYDVDCTRSGSSSGPYFAPRSRMRRGWPPRPEAAVQEESSASDKMPAIAYIVSVWPRLSETFILNEVLGLESRGARLRILSIKKPDAGTALARERVARVRAETICLSGASHWRAAFGPSLRVLARHPFRYCRTALLACRYRRWGARKRFFQAVCLADMLRRRPVAHTFPTTAVRKPWP